MGHWTKYYADGKIYKATDKEIEKKLASWRYSCNENIVGVELEYKNKLLRIKGLGEFWQSDGYESVYPGIQNNLIYRRIEKRIEKTDKYLTFQSKPNFGLVVFNNNCGGDVIPILPEWFNKWFVLEINTRSNLIQYYFTDKKI